MFIVILISQIFILCHLNCLDLCDYEWIISSLIISCSADNTGTNLNLNWPVFTWASSDLIIYNEFIRCTRFNWWFLNHACMKENITWTLLLWLHSHITTEHNSTSFYVPLSWPCRMLSVGSSLSWEREKRRRWEKNLTGLMHNGPCNTTAANELMLLAATHHGQATSIAAASSPSSN